MSSFRLSRRRFLRSAGVALGASAVAGRAAPALGRAGLRPGAVAADAPALQLARVGPVSGRQLAVVASLDDTHAFFGDGTAEFLLWPGDRERLDAAGIPYRITDADVLAGARADATASSAGAQPGLRDAYRLPDDYEADLRELAADFPDLTRFIELPHRSLEGRTTYGIEIASNPGARDGRAVVWHDGLIHAREWPAGEMPIMWAYDLLENYGTDPRITNIVDNARTFVLPLLNIDGFIESRTALVDNSLIGNPVTGNSYHRKNMRSHTGREEQKAQFGLNRDYYGIDLNRNFTFLWGDNQGSSSSQTSETYRGAAPFSEPVCRNVRDLQLAHAPITAITHHTYGRLMLYAWGRNPNQVRSPYWEEMQALGDAMRAFNNYTPQQAFGLYPTSGTSRDWAHAAIGTYIFTYEHATAFHPAYGSTIAQMYSINRQPFLLLAEAAIDPASHAVLRGRVTDAAGNPVAAQVHVRRDQRIPTAQGALVEENLDTYVDVEEDGTFAFHVPPSTRPYLAEPQFGGPTTEPYDVVVVADGREPVHLPVTVVRGDDADLDTITV